MNLIKYTDFNSLNVWTLYFDQILSLVFRHFNQMFINIEKFEFDEQKQREFVRKMFAL